MRIVSTPESRDAGMTLIEVVVALVVLGVLAVATLGILLTTQRTSVDARNRVAAANLAAREIDLVREKFLATADGPTVVADEGVVVNGNPLAGGAIGQPYVVDGVAYTVRRSTSWNITGTGASACEGGSIVEHPSLVVHVEVTWPGMGTTRPVTSSTVLAPERGQGLDSTASFVAIMVKDSKGQPNPGRTVIVSSASESRSAVTDSSGCAVVALDPPNAGAEYRAVFPDAGYVDMSGTTSPVRVIGLVTPGQLVSNIQISLERAGRLRVKLVGDGITDGDVAGSIVSLVQAEASGQTVTQRTMTGLETVVDDLWPTNYGAFFGTEMPAVIPSMVELPPGGTAVIEVPFEFAHLRMTDVWPAGGRLLAGPTGAACNDPAVRQVDAGDIVLAPGKWDFFLEHDDYGCTLGPTEVELLPGVNSDHAWERARLEVRNAPNGVGSVWAAPADVPGAASCTSAGGKAVKLSSSGGNIAPRELPAGDWYLFAMPESGGQPSGSPCADAGLVAVPYGTDTVFTWGTHEATLRVTNVPSTPGTSYRVIAHTSGSLYCSTNAIPAGAYPFEPGNSPTQSRTLSQGTWYVYRLRTSGGTGNRCTGGHQVTIGWEPSYTLNFSTGSVTKP